MWLLSDKKIYDEIDIPRDILVTFFDDLIVVVIESSTYTDFMNNYKCYYYLKSRKILTPTIEVVDQINNYILQMMSGIPITLY